MIKKFSLIIFILISLTSYGQKLHPDNDKSFYGGKKGDEKPDTINDGDNHNFALIKGQAQRHNSSFNDSAVINIATKDKASIHSTELGLTFSSSAHLLLAMITLMITRYLIYRLRLWYRIEVINVVNDEQKEIVGV